MKTGYRDSLLQKERRIKVSSFDFSNQTSEFTFILKLRIQMILSAFNALSWNQIRLWKDNYFSSITEYRMAR